MTDPLCTVLICTHNRRELFKGALACYLSQEYENKELVVVESGSDRVHDLLQDIPNCTYICFPAKSLSEKRNVGVAGASGEFICNFDDDDWSGPRRVAAQVEMLIARPEAQIAGYSKCFWWDRIERVASHYRGSMWGASICYRKDFAIKHPWPEDITYAEDSQFIAEASLLGLAVSMDAISHFVGVMHSGNAKRQYDPKFWPKVDPSQLPLGFRTAEAIA